MQLLGSDYDGEPFEPSHCLLLTARWHTRYDAYSWSLHHKVRSLSHKRSQLIDLGSQDGVYYSIIFEEAEMGQQQDYHGKPILPPRFNPLEHTSTRPDPRLCRWHFEQCVMMYLRGFAVGMRISS